jgi:hypothetical protein
MKMVRIKYFKAEPLGRRRILSGLMPRKEAERIIASGRYDEAEIVEDSEGK